MFVTFIAQNTFINASYGKHDEPFALNEHKSFVQVKQTSFNRARVSGEENRNLWLQPFPEKLGANLGVNYTLLDCGTNGSQNYLSRPLEVSLNHFV